MRKQPHIQTTTQGFVSQNHKPKWIVEPLPPMVSLINLAQDAFEKPSKGHFNTFNYS